VVTDNSYNPFTLLAPEMTVFSPNGGENWNGGETQAIT